MEISKDKIPESFITNSYINTTLPSLDSGNKNAYDSGIYLSFKFKVEKLTRKINFYLNSNEESLVLIKFLIKLKKHLMNFLGNLKQDLEFYTIIRENIDSVIKKIEEIILYFNKTFSILKSKKIGLINEDDTKLLILSYIKLGELINFIFQIYTNNLFIKLAILFFDKVYKSFLKIKCKSAQKIISLVIYESFTNFIEIIINKKIDYIDKFKDSKINYQLIKTINKILDLIIILNDPEDEYETNLIKSKKFPNISEVFNYLLISRTNIFSLNVYIFFDNFSETFYEILKKLILISISHFEDKKIEEIKAVLNVNLFKLLEISRIKDDLKNSIEDSQHEFYLDSLNLHIKITKLIIKNFYKYNILEDDNIKDKICRFMIELSFWDSLDVVDNTCKFFVLLWKISIKFKVSIRSDMEKIIEYLFLRRFKTYFNLLNDSEDSLVKLSVLEILLNYLNILIREYNFAFVIYLNYDFCKIRFNLLSEILMSCQKYFELTYPIYSHLKSNITNLYLNIFDNLYEVFINNNFSLNKNKLNNKKNIIINEVRKSPDMILDDIDNIKNNSIENSSKLNNSEKESDKNKFKDENTLNLDNKLIKEIQNLHDLWNDEILGHVNLKSPNFKKFNNKICALFSLKPIEVVNKKKQNSQRKEEEIVIIDNNKDFDKESSNNSSLNEISLNSEDLNTSLNSNNNNMNLNIDIDVNNSTQDNVVINKELIEPILSEKKNIEKNNENSKKIEEKNTPNILTPENVQHYRKLAYSMAIMIKYSFYVDIEKLYEIFGNKNDFSKLILEEYLKTFDFTGLDILKAYRIFVSTFKLTGESDNIYNMIINFSEKYYKDNTNDSNLRSVDEVSTLAYSILMLNTDLHDPKIKEHMTLDGFLKNVLSTRMFDHVSNIYLENIYKSISSNSLKVPNQRIDDYSKIDEVFEILKSKRNFLKKISSKNEENLFISDFNICNSNEFILDILNFSHDENSNKYQESNFKNNCDNFSSSLKIKRNLNFSLFNLCENFNIYNLKNSSEIEVRKEIDIYSSDKINNKKIIQSIYYMLWEDIFYNFMSISSKFYEIKDENMNKIFDKICVISEKLNKKENIDKLIVNYKKFIFRLPFIRL